MAPVITDPRFTPGQKRSKLDRFALRMIRDERDLPFIRLSVAMTLVLIPAAVTLFAWGEFSWWWSAAYWAVLFGLFNDRLILMLHNTSHRRLFKREYNLWNLYIPWVLGPLCGETPETYFAHHVGMHHAEENLREDLSSTMPYQRDRLTHWLFYFFRFLFAIVIELSMYMGRKGRQKLRRRMLIGEIGWWVVALGLGALVSWQAAATVYLIPVFIVRFMMMAGNWAQHAFIDPSDPTDPYKSSITCINTRYNRRCFNDGYHIGHHEAMTRHWTDMPADFERKKHRYVERDAVIFEGIDYFQVWLYLMLGRYDWLANRFVDLREIPRSKQEIADMLRARTAPVPYPS